LTRRMREAIAAAIGRILSRDLGTAGARMKPRDCVRLLIVGVCTGLLPACSNGPRPNEQPYIAQTNYEQASPTAPVAPLRPAWSPYGANTMPSQSNGFVVRGATVEKAPLPGQPRVLANDQLPSPTSPPDGDTVSAAVRSEIQIGTAPTIVQVKADEPPSSRKMPVSAADEPGLVAALRCFMDKRPDAAIPCLNRYDAENQEVLLNLLPLTARMGEGPLSQADPQEIAVILDQLQGLRQHLGPRAALVMDKICFCRQFRKFGVYEALGDKPSFRQGESVEVYCEIRNVSCEPSKSQQGEYRTHLLSSLEFRDLTGGFKHQYRKPRVDVSHTPQHDHYLHYSFAITDDMRPGTYALTVEVVDVPTGRKVSRRLEFVVRAE